MARFIYSCFFYLAIPLVMLRLFKRSLKEPEYRAAIAERFGFFRSSTPGEVIWVHAVSAGETIAAAPLVRLLIARGYSCLVTNMTPTGRERVRVLLGNEVENCYAPYDLPGSVRRFIRNNRPRLLITIDTELWPNTVAACARYGIPVMLVNGRLSSRSASGYRRIHPLIHPMLQSLDLLAVQTQQHKDRFVSLGAEGSKVVVTGSIKFDGVVAGDIERRLERASRLVAGRIVLMAASTHEGEEAAFLSMLPELQRLIPDVLLVLAPRHTHRCDQVRALCQAAGQKAISFSDATPVSAGEQILVVDVMGELDAFFSLATVAFVGGSLVPVGGHNLLEAVRAGTPVIMGSHLDNIEDIAQQFIDRHAMKVVGSTAELTEVVFDLMENPEKVKNLVAAAEEVLAENTGALSHVEKLIIEALGDH